MSRRLVQAALAALCLTVFALPSSAQVFTGRVDVVVKDSTGAVLPGVTVELTGVQTERAVTDSQGSARFLNLAPGKYALVAKLSGFNDYKNDNVPVGAGSIVDLPVVLTIGAVTENVNVTVDTPVIETKKQTVRTNVSLDELQNIPSSRDPWVVLQTVPGIIVDRVNVGGAESGQQSNYQAKGAIVGDNTWNMDGIAITDMAAIGTTPTYYDFDMFQEMQITTGGADPANPTGGVQLNFVLRGGTNRWRASGRYYFENNDLQSDNVSTALTGTLQSYNRFHKYTDYGVEGGGPVIADKLFVWGAYGKTNPQMEIYTYNPAERTVGVQGADNCTGFGTYTAPALSYVLTARDCTTLENYSFKGTGVLSNNLRATFTYFRGAKVKTGRSASDTRPAETTHNQKGPTSLYKGEVNYTLSNSTFLTARYAYTSSVFSLEPQGGRDTQRYQDDAGVYHNTYGWSTSDRPQNNFQVEGNHFKGKHELKFGFGWRKVAVASQSGFPGGLYTQHTDYPDMYTTIVRDWAFSGNGKYWSAFVGDQINLDRLTLNLGLRWDRQIANLEEASVPANPLSPLLGALTSTPKEGVVTYNSVTPRLGLTYALNNSRKTIARVSYGMFASQISSYQAFTVSQIPYYSYVYYISRDLNGNKITDPNELIAFDGTGGFDPTDPLGGNPDTVGKYKTPKTHEALIGLEHELMKNFGLSANFTWRKFTDFNWTHTVGLTSADYTQVGVFTGSQEPIGSFEVPLYAVNASAVPSNRARVLEARDGYSQRYWGVEIAATKRMSDRWMMRMGWATNDHREYFDGPDSLGDPTSLLATPNVDGGNVMVATTGSGKSSIYMVLPKYQYNLSGSYQAKFDINLGMNYVFRQGFAQPFHQTRAAGSADRLSPSGKSVLLIGDVTDYRLPNVHSLDMRVNKAIRFNDKYVVNLDMDIFNLFNNATILGRVYDRRFTTTFNQAREIMNPRIIRLGIRVGF